MLSPIFSLSFNSFGNVHIDSPLSLNCSLEDICILALLKVCFGHLWIFINGGCLAFNEVEMNVNLMF